MAMKILFADDHSAVRGAMTEYLKMLGHEVVAVSDGQFALEILEGGADFGLLITDYRMPRMNGLELMKAAKKLKPDIRVIVNAFNTPEEVIKEVEELGEHFVPKTTGELEKVLEEIERGRGL